MGTSEKRPYSLGKHLTHLLALVLAALMLGVFPNLGAAQEANNGQIQTEFLDWARHNLHPVASLSVDAGLSELDPLQQMIGDATVVSFGEGLHGGAEPLEFRNLLFRFLVEKMGFTGIVIESDMAAGFKVNEYVLGGAGDLKTIVANGFTNGFNRLPQEATLVEWMRAYNADPKHTQKIQFFAFNAGGGLQEALQYLDKVDPAKAASLRKRIGPLPRLSFSRSSGQGYPQLSQQQRDLITATIADMISTFKLNRATFIAATSKRAYQYAYRAAISARQSDERRRTVPIGWTPKDGGQAVLATSAVSDQSAADNVRWAKEQLSGDRKILVFAHRDHIATTLITDRFPSGNRLQMPSTLALPPLLGTYLKSFYGNHLVTIANLLDENTSNLYSLTGAGCKATRPPASSGSLESLLAKLNSPNFILDLRTAPPDVASWLEQPHELYGLDYPDTMSVGKAFDIVFFSRLVTPAVPCS